MVLLIIDDSGGPVQRPQSEPLIAEAAWNDSMNCRWFSSPNDGGGANLRSSLRVLLARISGNSLRSRRAVFMQRGQHLEKNKISLPQENSFPALGDLAASVAYLEASAALTIRSSMVGKMKWWNGKTENQ